MAEESIDLARHRDFEGRGWEPWARRLLLAALVAVILLALLNTFGQKQHVSQAAGPKALLGVRAPERVRGGLLYQAVFTISARRDIKQPQLVLGPGWLDGLTINTVEPEASQESNRNGRVTSATTSSRPATPCACGSPTRSTPPRWAAASSSPSWTMATCPWWSIVGPSPSSPEPWTSYFAPPSSSSSSC
jgi:hypothetical protein